MTTLKIAQCVQLRELVPLHVRSRAKRMVLIVSDQNGAAHGNGVGLPAGIAAHAVLGVRQHAHTLRSVTEIGNVGNGGVTNAVWIDEPITRGGRNCRSHRLAWWHRLSNGGGVSVVSLPKANAGQSHHYHSRNRGRASNLYLHSFKSPANYRAATKPQNGLLCQQLKPVQA